MGMAKLCMGKLCIIMHNHHAHVRAGLVRPLPHATSSYRVHGHVSHAVNHVAVADVETRCSIAIKVDKFVHSDDTFIRRGRRRHHPALEGQFPEHTPPAPTHNIAATHGSAAANAITEDADHAHGLATTKTETTNKEGKSECTASTYHLSHIVGHLVVVLQHKTKRK